MCWLCVYVSSPDDKAIIYEPRVVVNTFFEFFVFFSKVLIMNEIGTSKKRAALAQNKKTLI